MVNGLTIAWEARLHMVELESDYSTTIDLLLCSNNGREARHTLDEVQRQCNRD